ncbi:nucleotide exchange factor GrpE [Hallerella succinigenes]|uniref:Molecular chaperone GrpE (Heat shock protein) n=1 Tax=Hallerella succinigenes TaxID=1896222 RepID=A0A2M9A9A1_9BACT|nr:nucleotide exchange factor GrpE [Hallerella succinigenes]PJJ42311.1 molecular chaperone GrpE (heat shock protein) [Hallerella succinigenes]
MMKKILMAIMFATAIAFAADAAKTPAAAPAKTAATIPAPAAAPAEAAPVAAPTSVDVHEESSFNPMPLAVGGFVFVCLLIIGVWRSRRRAIVKVAEPPTEQEPPVESAGESEPNKSELNISDELQKMNASLQELKKAAQEKEKLLQINSEMHEELVGLRNGLADSIKKPLLMGLIQIYDRLEDLVKVNSNLPESEISATKILKTVNDIKLNSLDLLYEFDVEPVEPKIGDVFNPKEHKAIKTIMTDKATKDRTISSVRQIGFVNVSNSRMLRVGSVEVYKKQD